MEDEIDIESIIESLIAFLVSDNEETPQAFNIILKNNEHIQHTNISIFLAKSIRHIECHNIPLNIIDNTQSSLPQSIYYGIIHPSTEINKFCKKKLNEKHNEKGSITNVADYTNIIQPIIELITQNISFMRYTTDNHKFDQKEQKTNIKTYKNNENNNNNNIQYVESQLYLGLKILMDKVSENIINNQILSSETASDLFNILLARININNASDIANNDDQTILMNCICILRRLLTCKNNFLFWEHHNLLIPTVNELVIKLCQIFLNVFDLGLKKINLHKEVLNCLEVAVLSKTFDDSIDNIRLVDIVLNVLFHECWLKKKVSSKIMLYPALCTAFRIILYYLNSKDSSTQKIIYPLISKWSKICINFTIAGNIDDDDEQENVRKRLEFYISSGALSFDNILKLQTKIVTVIVSKILQLDSKNVINIFQMYLFSFTNSEIICFREFNKNHNNQLLYQINSLWTELLSTNIDLWNYPGSIHKLMFELYHNFAVWDHLNKYELLLKNRKNKKEYFCVYKSWISRILKYFDNVLETNELIQSLFCNVQNVTSQDVVKNVISSYLLCGNKAIKLKIDKMIHNALNTEMKKDDNWIIINESLNNKNIKLILRHCMMNRQKFLMFFADDNEIKNKANYNKFIHLIVDGVLMCIEKFENTLETICKIPLSYDDNRVHVQYLFPTKHHVIGIIANIFNFIDYFRSNNIKWEQNNNNSQKRKQKKVDRCFSEIIFSTSDSLNSLIEYVLLTKDGILGGDIDDFIANRYFDNNEERIENLANILSFLSNHWTHYIEPIIDALPNTLFNYKCLFNWFQILKYHQIGKEWINLLTSITVNDELIKCEFNAFIKEKGNHNHINEILDKNFNQNKIKFHEKKCQNAKCSSYHLEDRQKLMQLLGGINTDLSVFMFRQEETNKNDINISKALPLKKKAKKKAKKSKQFKITEYLSPEKSVTPGNSPPVNGNKNKRKESQTEIKIDDVDTAMKLNSICSSVSNSPKPKSFMNFTKMEKKQIEIAPLKILDRQLNGSNNKLMYFVDYTDAAMDGPNWKYKHEIIAEFGEIGRKIVNSWIEENKEEEIETLWGVTRILDKRFDDDGTLEYYVLWDYQNQKSWQPIENLAGCKEAINEFEQESLKDVAVGKKRKMPDNGKPNATEPERKRRKISNNSSIVDSDDDDDEDYDDDDDESTSDLSSFIDGHYSDVDVDDEYDPNADRKALKNAKKVKPQLKKLQLQRNDMQQQKDVSLKLSDVEQDADVPISSNYLQRQQRKKERQKKRNISNINKKKRNRDNIDYSHIHKKKRQKLSIHNNNNQRSDVSSHLTEMMGSEYSFKKNNNFNGQIVAPSGDIVPTSNISSSFKRNVSKPSRNSKLSKMHRDHQNSILAGNIAAKQSNTFRKNDLSKTGNFKKRHGGAVILPAGHAKKNRTYPTIPKRSTTEIKSNKLKTKLPQKRNRYDNTLFKTQHKKNNQYKNQNTNNQIPNNFGRNRNQNHWIMKRDCEVELFSKILKWTPNYVETALNETKTDLTPMGDSYANAMEYKTLFEPFLLEEVRAQIAQTIQEKKTYRLCKRQVQDPSNQRNKHKHYSPKHEQLFDTAKITNYIFHPAVCTVILQPTNQYARFHKEYYKNDLVLLVQDKQLIKQAESKKLNIENILNASILGTIKSNSEKEPFGVYITANELYRAQGSLCMIIYLSSLITACREYQCLATMAENEWAPKIIQPKKILYVDGLTQLDIRDKQLPIWMKTKLNDGQLNAVSASLTRENNIILIKGPPGTGKTTTIVALMNVALLKLGYLARSHRPKILCCAPSNAAIDEIVSRAFDKMKCRNGEINKKIKMVRIGSGTRTGSIAEKIHIDKLSDPRSKLRKLQDQLKIIEKQQKQQRSKWMKNNRLRDTGMSEADKKYQEDLAEKLRNTQLQKSKIEDLIQQEKQLCSNNNRRKPDRFAIIREQDIVFSTLSAAATNFLNKIQFDLLIIDESTQACEISTLIPFQLNIRSIVLVGDEKQLPATVISNSCNVFGYSTSFFERCVREGVQPYLLDVQYRMHPEIRHWPSITFYENKLKDGANITKDVVPFVEAHSSDPRLGPYAFFDVYHHDEEFIKTSKTYTNRAELDFILRLLDYMSYKFYTKNKVRWTGNVGIVTPYRGQVNLFRKHLLNHSNKLLHSVVVDTVESFQGQEKDIIIFSCVRSQRQAGQNIEKANLGFLTDLRRLNVALTRARLCCFVVGNSTTLKANKTWKALIHDAHMRGCCYKVDNQDHKKWINRSKEQFKSTQQQLESTKNHNKSINSNNNNKCFDNDIKMSTKDDHQYKHVHQNGYSKQNGHVQPMDVDEDSSSKSKSNSVMSTGSSRSRSRSNSVNRDHRQHSKSRSRSSSSHHTSNHRHRDRSYDRNDRQRSINQQLKSVRKLTDAEIARILNLPEPPTDPRPRSKLNQK